LKLTQIVWHSRPRLCAGGAERKRGRQIAAYATAVVAPASTTDASSPAFSGWQVRKVPVAHSVRKKRLRTVGAFWFLPATGYRV